MGEEGGLIVLETVIKNTGADAVSDTNDETLIVDTSERFAGDFVNFEEVMEVGGGEMLAEVAVAVGINRSKLVAEAGVFDIDATVGGVESAVAGLARGGDTIESVTAVLSTDEEVARFGAHAK